MMITWRWKSEVMQDWEGSRQTENQRPAQIWTRVWTRTRGTAVQHANFKKLGHGYGYGIQILFIKKIIYIIFFKNQHS